MARTKSGLTLAALAAVLVVSSATAAPPKRSDPKLDLPRVWAAREPSAASWLWVVCTPLPDTKPRQARCSVTQANVRKRTPNQATAKLAESVGNALRWTKDAAAACWQADRSALPTTPALRERALAFSAACRARDWRTLASLLRAQSEEDAGACDVSLAPPKEDVYTQRDENTWTYTLEGACGAVAYTIWRRKYTDQHWNFTQVKSVPPNAEKGTLCGDLPPTPRTDWLDDDRPVVKLGCDLFK
jgi:hypothetical protein